MNGADRTQFRAGATSPRRWRRLPAISLLLTGVLVLLGCTEEDSPTTTVQPGAPGEPARVLPGGAPEVEGAPHSHLDVHFVQGMIAHHAQAVRMSDLVPDRTDRKEIHLIASRIGISQDGEITQMTAWLEDRGEAATPDPDHHPETGELMPGMLTEEQFAQLGNATGSDFDRLFLEFMIYHHEGALTMVADLMANGGGQDAELSQLVSHIDADQRIEIDRMRRLLLQLPA